MRLPILIFLVFYFLNSGAQPSIPKSDFSLFAIDTVITDPPNFSVRMMAEWEELQSIVVTWDLSFPPFKKKVLADIVKYAKDEVEVFILCSGAFSNDVVGRVKWELEGMGFENFDNLVFSETEFDGRIWVCLLYTSPSPRDQRGSRMPSSA